MLIREMYPGCCQNSHKRGKNYDPGCGTLNIDVKKSGLHTGFSDHGFHLPSDVVEAVAISKMEKTSTLNLSNASLKFICT